MSRDRMPYQSNTFEKIYCNEVINSVYNPLNLLTEAHRVLKPSGELYLTACNAGYYGWMTNTFHGGYNKKYGELDDTYYLYTKQGLANLLKLAGFGKINVEYRIDHSFRELQVKSFTNITIRVFNKSIGAINERLKPRLTARAYK